MINLDCSETTELKNFVETYTNSVTPSAASRYFKEDVHPYQFTNEDLLRALSCHLSYAILKLSARNDRMYGRINDALTTERILDQIHADMPVFARW